YLDSRPIIARVCAVTGLFVCGCLSKLSFEGNTLDEGEMPISLSLLVEPNNDAAFCTLDRHLGRLHLFAAIALSAVKNVSSYAMRMYAAEHIFASRYIAHNNGDRLMLAIVEKDLSECSEFSFEVTLG